MSNRPYYDKARAALDEAHKVCFNHPDRDVLGMSHGPFSGVNVALGIIAELEDYKQRMDERLSSGYRILAPGEMDRDGILQRLDPESATDDGLLRDIHRRLQEHGEKYPERAVSVLHRNVVLYTIASAIRALKGGSE